MKVLGDFLGSPHSTDNTTDNQSKKGNKGQELIQSRVLPNPVTGAVKVFTVLLRNASVI